MKKVYAVTNPTEGHMVKGILESHGIGCEVHGEILFSVRGEVPITPNTAPSVWIQNDAQYDEARGILAEYENFAVGAHPPAGPWTCGSCGESSDGQFTACWNCGEERSS